MEVEPARRPLASGQQVAPAGRQRDRHLHRHHRGQDARARPAGERAAAAGDHGFRGRRHHGAGRRGARAGRQPGRSRDLRPRRRGHGRPSRRRAAGAPGRAARRRLHPVPAPRWSGSAATASRFPAEVSMGLLCRSSGVRIATVRDVTLQKADRDRMLLQATHDELTGLPNRRLFDDRLDMTLRRAVRPGELVAVAFLDVDRFKTVNDSLGHGMGDRLLVALSRRLQASLRDSDTVARMGGDEFIFILPGLQRPEDAVRPVRQASGGRPRAGADRRAGAVRHRQRRRRRVPDRRAGTRHAATPRRRRALPGQGARPQPLRAVRSWPGDPGGQPGAARCRPATRRQPGRAEPGLPAADQLQDRQGRRLRGADALASPAARAGVARHLHPDRRGDRPDLVLGRLGPGAGVPRHGGLGPQRDGSAADRGQCLAAPAAA